MGINLVDQNKKHLEQILKKEGIRDFEKDIRLMSKAELRRHFLFPTSKKANPTGVIKNLVWQAYTWIRDGKRDPIEGNLRSFWYSSIKSVLSRLGINVSGRAMLEKLYDTFVELVGHYHLFYYRDMGFLDSTSHTRIIGQTHGNFILFVEKEGLYPIAREIALQYDLTTLSLSGFPSQMATEYLLYAMGHLGALNGPIRLFCITDWDPSGYWIEQSFAQQIESYGVKVDSIHSLTHPKRLSPDLVEVSKYRLKNNTKTENWIKMRGGIHGEAFGLEADVFGKRLLRQAFEEEVKPFWDQKVGGLEVGQDQQKLLEAIHQREGPGQTDVSPEEIVERIIRMTPAELRLLRQLLKQRWDKIGQREDQK
jgi:hypothetical protein